MFCARSPTPSTAHAAGLVHRDVKPDNILVDDSDFAYLTDFGIAQIVDDTRLTQAGSVVGSIAYMAPERFSDTSFDGSVDVYALACVLFDCLTGYPPFGGSDVPTVIRGHVLSPPPVAGSPFDPAISRGLAKEPRDRFLVLELITAAQTAASPTLVGYPQHLIDQRGPVASQQRPPTSRSGRTMLTAATILAVVVLVAMVAVGGYLIAHRDTDSTVQSASTGIDSAASATTAAVETADCSYPAASTTGIRPEFHHPVRRNLGMEPPGFT